MISMYYLTVSVGQELNRVANLSGSSSGVPPESCHQAVIWAAVIQRLD